MQSTKHSLIFLFKTFLMVGLTSFGGYTALVSILREEIVKKKKIVGEEDIVDGVSLASVLPGPLAVNVVAFVGYKLNGWLGAFVCMLAVLLSPIVLIMVIAHVYRLYSDVSYVNHFLAGVIPVVMAIILSLSYDMSRKHLTGTWQWIAGVVFLILIFYASSHLWIVLYLFLGGVAGYIFKTEPKDKKNDTGKKEHSGSRRHLYTGLLVCIIVFIALYFILDGLNRLLLFEFAKISLTLFGGGYVMISMLHEIVVNNFQWVSSAEFANAITFGQLTPGPILVSATYIGFIKGGITGALLATLGIFAPSAIVMILISNAFESLKSQPVVQDIMSGIRPVVIALITYSVFVLFKPIEHKLLAGLILILSYVIITKTKINYFFLIAIGGVVGILFY